MNRGQMSIAPPSDHTHFLHSRFPVRPANNERAAVAQACEDFPRRCSSFPLCKQSSIHIKDAQQRVTVRGATTGLQVFEARSGWNITIRHGTN